jgi:hypothetical protein
MAKAYRCYVENCLGTVALWWKRATPHWRNLLFRKPQFAIRPSLEIPLLSREFALGTNRFLLEFLCASR